MDMATALKEIETWPLEERLQLVEKVWDQIVASGWQPQLSDEEKKEIDRRLDALEANPGDVVTWESVVEHVRKRP